jgi:hypothetical protein
MLNLILAYVIIAVLLAAYVGTLVIRTRRLNRALEE